MTVYATRSRPTDTAEQRRLNEAREAENPVEALGSVPVRAAVGHRPRGLQRRTATPGTTSATTRRARAPTAGARTASPASRDDQQRLCFALALWNGQRPDPQGAALRPDQQRGQPRRGRQGVLLLPRLDADALVHAYLYKYPQRAFPYDDLVDAEPRARPERVRVRAARHRRLRRRPLLRRVRRVRQGGARTTSSSGSRVANRGPEAATLHLLPTLWFRNTWSWQRTATRPTLRASADRRRSSPTHAELGELHARLRRRRPSCCSPRTRRTHERLCGPAQRDAVREGRLQRYVVHGEQDAVNPAAGGPRPPRTTG